VAQIVRAPSTVVARSADIAPGRLLSSTVPPRGRTVIATVDHPPVGDGSAYRVGARLVAGAGADTTVVLAAASLEPTEEALAAVRRVLLVGIPALLLLVAAVTWVAVGRALAPVEAMRRTVADISLSALDQRVPEPSVRDEIGRLAATMNDMLGRLEAANARQRAFVADASHELRSPLASIQTQLDVALAHPEQADWPTVATQIAADSWRLQRMVDDLLFLATGDERARPARQVEVDLDELVLAAVLPVRARGRVRVDVAGVSGGRLHGDPAGLERLVANLVENAERHARGFMSVAVNQTNGTVELTVADDGPGIAVADQERIFERFTRVDEARDREHGGAGLGLAIARDVAVAHGGTITAVSASPDPGTRFVVRLPL
jgi:signal transduction histidine kinase